MRIGLTATGQRNRTPLAWGLAKPWSIHGAEMGKDPNALANDSPHSGCTPQPSCRKRSPNSISA